MSICRAPPPTSLLQVYIGTTSHGCTMVIVLCMLSGGLSLVCRSPLMQVVPAFLWLLQTAASIVETALLLAQCAMALAAPAVAPSLLSAS